MPARFISLLRNLFRRRSVERSLDAEVHAYLDMLTQEKIAGGMAPDTARRAARIELGGIEQVKEEVRQIRTGALLEQLVQDVRYGVRTLRRSPVFTLVAVVTLGLAIGANTSVFTVVNAVLLRPLPYAAPDSLFAITGLNYVGDFMELRTRARTFDVAAHGSRQVALTGAGEPVRLGAAALSADALRVLGTAAASGRAFEPGEDRTGATPVVIVSDAAWRRRFGADPSLVGRLLRVDGIDRRVVGIMPAGFRFPNAATELWLPLEIDPANPVALWSTSVRMIGRVRPGATLDQAAGEVRALGPSMRPLFPWKMPEHYGATAGATPLHESIVGDVDSMLFILLVAVGVVLLIACVNVSNLLIGRALTRRRELAVRSALGAGAGRIVRQLLTESALIAAAGGLLGLVLAAASMGVLVALLPSEVPRVTDIAIDLRVLAFTAAAALGSGILTGAVPAWRASRLDVQSRLVEGERSGSGARSRWISSGLVAAEIALAVLLVIAAVLLARSFANLVRAQPGFRSENLISATVVAPEFRYRDAPARREFYRGLLERVAATSGIQAAAFTDRLPFASQLWGSVFIVEGRPNPATEGGDWPWADVRAAVSEHFLDTIGVPVLKGRAFTPADGPTAQRVVLISETLARKYWPGEQAVGRRITFPGLKEWWTIAGVVGDLVWERAGEEPRGSLYLPLSQTTPGTLSVVVRTTRAPSAFAGDLRAIVASLDRDAPVDDVRTMDQRITQSVEQPRFAMLVLGAFAGVGLLLGAVGVYGSVSELVRQRRREIGVRMALGAQPRDVLTAVLRHAVLLVAAGVVVGAAGTSMATRGLSTLLYGVTATDPLTFTLVPLVLGLVALAASYAPALRATRVDPLIVLRHE